MEMQMQMIELTATTILASFAIVMVVIPLLIEKLKKRGTVTIDYYKRDSRKIPARGGVVILAVVFLLFGVATSNTCRFPFQFM
jgi:UDP-N-acetylmuramyl pentapeptide phosphotransferase/UDP-N-acetylglucosamine-1-phosphate transferase